MLGCEAVELGLSAPVRVEDKPSDGLSVRDGLGSASPRPCSESVRNTHAQS